MRDLKQRVQKTLRQEPSLRFVAPFLEAFPKGDLYLVGGAVRDLLLGRSTVDFDFVVRGVSREPLEAWFETRGRVDVTGRVFGVYKFVPTLPGLPTIPIDLALPRTETALPGSLGGYRDFDTQSNPMLPIEADLARRDFSINACAFDLRRGTLIDVYQGQRDLEARIVRAVGNPTERFSEDFSRMLRAIRFAVQLDFEIDTDTWDALCALMPELNRTRTRPDGGSEFVLPRETIGRELAKALTAHPLRAARLLHDSGVLQAVLPDIARAANADAAGFFLPLASKPSLPVTLALLLRAASPDTAKRALDRAGLSSLPRDSVLRVAAEDVAWVVRGLQHIPAPETVRAQPVLEIERMFMGLRGGMYLEALQALGKTLLIDAIRERVTSIRLACKTPDGDIPQLINGSDVLAVGIPAGPKIRAWLDAVREEQLNGRLRKKDEARAWLQAKMTSQTD